MEQETNLLPDKSISKPRKRIRAPKTVTPSETAENMPKKAAISPTTPPTAPGIIKRAWAFIHTNSAVLDLMVNTLTFLIVACFGTWLVFKQNNLMENQNALVKQQMSLDEAGRRSALIALMSNIMDKVDDEIKDQKDDLLKRGLSRAAVDTMKFSLSQSLIGQIAALSHSFKPYRFMDADTLIDKPLSPERGQLLITLTRLPLKNSTFYQIFYSATFENSDLKRASLNHVNLNIAELSKSNLNEAQLAYSNLKSANLGKATLVGADLAEVNLEDANLSEANLSGSYLTDACVRNAVFFGSNLEWAYLKRIDFRQARLNQANLSNTQMYGTIMSIQQAKVLKALGYVQISVSGSCVRLYSKGLVNIFWPNGPQTNRAD